MKKVSKKSKDSSPEEKKFPLPVYPDDEDIYKKEKEQRDRSKVTDLACQRSRLQFTGHGHGDVITGNQVSVPPR